MPADRWTYRFFQMQNGRPGFTTEAHLFDLPINGATFSSKLNDVGQLSGTFQLTDPGVQKALLGQPSLDLLCDRTAIYVDLNGQLVWGGILQQVNPQRSTGQCQIQGQDWWGYLANNRLLTWNSTYSAIEQVYVAADLVNSAQGAPYSSSASGTDPNGNSYHIAGYAPQSSTPVGGNVGVTLGVTPYAALAGTYPGSGVAVTQSWLASSFKSPGSAISDVGSAADGFDWTIDVAYNASGVPVKTFNVWWRRAGRTFQAQLASGGTVVFNIGGTSGQDYQWPTGTTKPANTLFAAGSGAGGTAIESQASDPALVDSGWPLLEDSISYTDVTAQALLDQATQSQLQARKYPVRLPVITYNAGADSDQPLGSFALGDDCRLMIPPDSFFPSGYDSEGTNFGEQWWRVMQIATTVNDEGKSNMQLTLAVPPVFPGT